MSGFATKRIKEELEEEAKSRKRKSEDNEHALRYLYMKTSPEEQDKYFKRNKERILNEHEESQKEAQLEMLETAVEKYKNDEHCEIVKQNESPDITVFHNEYDIDKKIDTYTELLTTLKGEQGELRVRYSDGTADTDKSTVIEALYCGEVYNDKQIIVSHSVCSGKQVAEHNAKKFLNHFYLPEGETTYSVYFKMNTGKYSNLSTHTEFIEITDEVLQTHNGKKRYYFIECSKSQPLELKPNTVFAGLFRVDPEYRHTKMAPLGEDVKKGLFLPHQYSAVASAVASASAPSEKEDPFFTKEQNHGFRALLYNIYNPLIEQKLANDKQVRQMIELSAQLNEKNSVYYDKKWFTLQLKESTERLDGNPFNPDGFIEALKRILKMPKGGGKSKKRNQKKTKKRRGQKKSKKQQRK
jgi:hypothetical protein